MLKGCAKMFGFSKKKKSEKMTITKEEFGKYALSRMALISAGNSEDLFKELEIEDNNANYMLYLNFILLISKKLLQEKYSSKDADLIINAAIDGVVLSLFKDVPTELQDTTSQKFKEMFSDIEEDCNLTNCNTNSEQGLKNFASSFLEWCGVGKSFIGHTIVFTYFSSFIIHHLVDVVGNGFIII